MGLDRLWFGRLYGFGMDFLGGLGVLMVFGAQLII